MKNTFITSYENLTTRKAGIDVNLLDWLKDESHKDLIMHLRTLDNKDEYNRIKKTLPCALLSGTFKTRHNDALKEHSGYICIDIDGKDNPQIGDYKRLRDELKNIVNVSYSALSVGGKGVFCLIPISNPDKHREHFFALEKCFEELGIVIDKSCKNVGRLRIMSYDPDAYFNENAVPFTEIAEEAIPMKKPRERPKQAKTDVMYSFEKMNFDKDKTKKKVLDIIQKIKSSKKDITRVYEEWFKLACALYAEFGEDGRELYHELSKNNPTYDTSKCDAQFDVVVERRYNRTKIGTFFHIAKGHGLLD